MTISNFKFQNSNWTNIRSMCLLLLLAASPLVSTRIDAQDATLPRSGLADPTKTTKEMRHLAPANVKEIREICPDVSCEFILQQIEAGATIYEAQAAYQKIQAIEVERLKAERSTLTAKMISQIRKACPGVSGEFILQQIEASATVFEAQAAYQKIQAIEIERLKAERSTLTAKMISQIRDVCPGASDQFILKLVESGATIDDARNAYEKLRLAEIDRLRSENAQLVADKQKLRRQAVTVAAKLPPMALQGRVLSGGDEGIARIKIDKQIYRIRQGQQLAITTEGVLMKIVAEEISAGAVRLHLMPQNVRMEL